jgi:hypothetical protein
MYIPCVQIKCTDVGTQCCHRKYISRMLDTIRDNNTAKCIHFIVVNEYILYSDKPVMTRNTMITVMRIVLPNKVLVRKSLIALKCLCFWIASILIVLIKLWLFG